MRLLFATLLCVLHLFGLVAPAAQAWTGDDCCAEETDGDDGCAPSDCHCACCPGRVVLDESVGVEASAPNMLEAVCYPPVRTPVVVDCHQRVFHPPKSTGVLPARR